MRLKLQNFLKTPVMQKFQEKLSNDSYDPVRAYAVFLVMTVMYYYHADRFYLYAFLAIPISWCMMKFYDFVAKHKWIGPLCYLVYMFAGLELIGMIVNWGQRDYPISFLVWFLTPQSVVSFSGWYTAAIYLLMLGFLTSIVYYFAKTRYRMSMQFLIMLIPLSFYAKEGQHMPAILVIVLLASYFLLMIYCRMLRDTDKQRYIPSSQGKISIVMYVITFSVLASVIPKPTITPDREFIDNAMSYSSWSDILMNAISMFTDTTDNTVSTSNNTRTIYYVNSPESLRLRTQTYSYYNSAEDSWNISESYDRPFQDLQEPMTDKPQDVLQAILDAAALDQDFAETYDLTEFAGMILPEQDLRELYLYTRFTTQVLPSPTRTMLLGSEVSKDQVWQSAMNTVSAPNFANGVSLQYYPDTYAKYEAVNPVLKKLSNQNYHDLLLDAIEILENREPEQAELLIRADREYNHAYSYLDFVNVSDSQSEIIQTLAKEITAGLESDFEKAQAIEQYFVQQGFVYDQSYQKANGEDAAYFLTQSRTGVCYEFATAMVLLCRSAGLPARYTQGYHLNELYNFKINQHDTNYLIKVRDAHAFPEVYISGYGWLSFEPTVPSMDLPDSTKAENQAVMQWGFVILVLALLAGVIYFKLPTIQEFFFRKKLLHMTPQTCAVALFQHMRRQLRLSDSTTVQELAARSRFFCPADATACFDAFFAAIDVLLYDCDCQNQKKELQTQEMMTALQLAGTYLKWQAFREQFLKEQAQQKKLAKKQEKQLHHKKF
ncbi:MAG: transglutaminase-like domain-containing protein [Oscillospiraceae bacterium]|nr:transglutaminase-like domain-containing protein [Oscillospiraceae bacterium]